MIGTTNNDGNGVHVDCQPQHSQSERYWLDKFSGKRSKNFLPYDFRKIGTRKMLNIQFSFGGELYSQLIKLSNQSGPRLHMILVTGAIVLLNKYTHNNDITVAVPVYKQEEKGELFNTALPLRNEVNPGASFKDLLLAVRQSIVDAVDHQNYPIELLMHQLQNQASAEDSSLVDIAVLLKNVHEKEYIQHLSLDMCFVFDWTDDGLKGTLEYNSGLYRETSIQRIIKYYSHLLEQGVFNLDTPISQLDTMTGEEKEKILFDFNNTSAAYQEFKTIHELFQDQVEKTPDHMAINCIAGDLTYKELNEKSNRLAHLLQRQGVVSQSIVCLMKERSLDMIVGILGILKAGGAYLPIDPEYPEARIKYMLKDSNANFLLKDSVSELDRSGLNACTVLEFEDLNFESVSDLDLCAAMVSSSNLAYVIYTSGSTGNPKGTPITHRNVNNYATWFIGAFQIEVEDRFSFTGSFCFDMSVTSLLVPLISGASIYTTREKIERDPQVYLRFLAENRISIVKLTPTQFRALKDFLKDEDLSALRYIILGGEAVDGDDVRDYLAIYNQQRIVNEYGPTETTVAIVYYIVDDAVARGLEKINIPIGKPIFNHRIYILDNNLGMVPIGVPGELCIAGDGLSEGYLNKPELTAEKFIMLNNELNNSPERIYRSGDLCMWLPDGNIEYLGRMDSQVKIRGFRIELGEIENQILKHNEVKEAVVAARNENGEIALCAYLVSEKEFDVQELREFLSLDLPDYMVPSYFALLEEIPLLPNGKVDRKNLPDLKNSRLGLKNEHVAPRNDEEKLLAQIWREILGAENIGIHDNFFQLGGHSLKAVSIVTRINKELQAKLPLSLIFDKPTISEMVTELQARKGQVGLKIETCPLGKYYQLSHAQKRLWFFHQMEPVNPAYNVSLNLLLKGDLDLDAFKKAVEMLMYRHELLRTSIETLEEGGQPVQFIHDPRDVSLDIRQDDISNLAGDEKKQMLSQRIREVSVEPFELDSAPLFRLLTIRIEPNRHAAIFVLHHITCDAWSLRILNQEFTDFYNRTISRQDDDLLPLTYQYKDFANWQNQLISEQGLGGQRNYWHEKLAGEIPVLDLQPDYPRTTSPSLLGDKVSFVIDESLTRKLKRLGLKKSASLAMILMAAFKVLISRYTQQEDIILGTLTSGRNASEFENVVGYFLNIFALRDTVKGNISFEEFLGDVRRTMLDAYDNEDYPFDKLVDELSIKRDMGRTPVFDIMMVFQTLDEVEVKSTLESLEIELMGKDYVVNKYEMYLDVFERPNYVYVNFEFRPDLYKKETIERMSNHYLNILNSAANAPEQQISHLEMISESEKQEVLSEFNDTEREIPDDKCYHELFQQQVAADPERIACKHNGETVTYRQLNGKANKIAHYLIQQGIKPGKMVALLMKRSIWMLAAMIGVFKAGGLYVPVEVEYPEERIRFMLKDAEATVVIVNPGSAQIVQKVIAAANDSEMQDYICLDPSIALASFPEDDPMCSSAPDDCAYMIYTSGSTGKPKGALIQQQGMINHLFAKVHDLSINENDRIAQTASHCFDISVWQFLAALLKGGTTVIYDLEVVLDPPAMLKGLQEEQITIFESVPSLLTVFLEMLENKEDIELNDLRWMIPTGEALKPSQVNQWFKYYPHIPMVNAYGPTEASDDITHYIINSPADIGEWSVPIGKPVQNMKIYILSKELSLCPIGVRGEICVAGIGVGKGYWKEPQKTNRVFIPNPFVDGNAEKKYSILYKTGDVGYYREDGNIECLGRIDNQVKIRGFRIELEEIENVILTHPAIAECAVIVKKNEEKADSIAAFFIEKETVDIVELKQFLLKHLPLHMIPPTFMKLVEMPLSNSGKADRQALAAMEIEDHMHADSDEDFSSPQSDTELKIANIWADALEIKVDSISLNHNFFDLGGHSLLIPRIHRELEKEFKDTFNIAKLFEFMTIQQLAGYVSGTTEAEEDDEIIELAID
jgi:tyrocidine synthetase III